MDELTNYKDFEEIILGRLESGMEVPIPDSTDTAFDINEQTAEVDSSKDESESKPVIPQKHKYITNGKELYNLPYKEFPCLLYPILPKVGLAAIIGCSDAFKTTLLRQFAVSIVSGEKSFLDFEIHAEHHRVLYISTEDDELSVSMLLKKQYPDSSIGEKLEGLGYIFDIERLDYKLKETLSKTKIDCLIVDAFADVYTGNMVESNKVREFLNLFRKLSLEHHFLVIFLHHTRKGSEQLSPSKNNALGSQGFEAKMRVVIELKKDPYEGDIRHFCIVKGNYLGEDFKKSSYKLRVDSNMRLTYTHERTPFELIVKPVNTIDPKSLQKLKVKELHDSGKSLRDIEKFFQDNKQPISKSTIGNWINSLDKISNTPPVPDFSYVSDEDCMEDAEITIIEGDESNDVESVQEEILDNENET